VSISVRSINGVRRIDVLGELGEGEDELAPLLATLVDADGEPRELVFYDARTLPGAVTERLAQLVGTPGQPRIRVYHPYLLYYLMRLGIEAHQVPSKPPCPPARFAALAIGGSADSLDKMVAIVEALPPGPFVVFVVQHVLENEPSLLDKLLQAHTDLRVVMPQHLARVEPGTIYVAPPGRHMKVAHGLVYLTRDQKLNFARPSLDALFVSVAEEYREEAMAVLLCGYGCDGVAGLRRIGELGGCALVEDGSECAARDMPDAAVAAQVFDHVLDLPALRCFVAAAASDPAGGATPPLIDLLLEAVYTRYGYDYRGYQRGTVERRLDNLLSALSLPNFYALQREILTDPDAFERLFLDLSINVTTFFRHPEQFRVLREQVLPYLDSFPHIKIWSAGCANGKEAYSLAMLLDELGILDKAQIFATDINPYQLEEARSGLYPGSDLAEAANNYRASGGQGDLGRWLSSAHGYLKVEPRLRGHMLFYTHSLVHDGPFNEFQLIICRNVMIYFRSDLQCRVVDLFTRSLHRDGFLMLGPSESGVAMAVDFPFAREAGEGSLYRWPDMPSAMGRATTP